MRVTRVEPSPPPPLLIELARGPLDEVECLRRILSEHAAHPGAPFANFARELQRLIAEAEAR